MSEQRGSGNCELQKRGSKGFGYMNVGTMIEIKNRDSSWRVLAFYLSTLLSFKNEPVEPLPT